MNFAADFQADHYILVEGKPVLEADYLKWGIWFEDCREECEVAETFLGRHHEVRISTRFMGMEQHKNPNLPPSLWETMVFGLVQVFGAEGSYDQYRYRSEEDARAGHEAVVTKLQAAMAIAQESRPHIERTIAGVIKQSAHSDDRF